MGQLVGLIILIVVVVILGVEIILCLGDGGLITA